MKKITKRKPIKMVEPVKLVEVSEVYHHGRAQIVKTTLSFFGSFILIVGCVLGSYWYGRQLYQTVKTIFRAPLTISPVSRMATEYFDPLDIAVELHKKKSDIIFLDIRSADEYKKEHIKRALSLPVYAIKNGKMEYINITTLSLKGIDQSKQVIIYGPSSSFQKQQTLLIELKKKGYTAQLLAVGWNELRHFQNIWIPEGLWGALNVNSFIDKNDVQ
ncbi:MAG: rhodanese-like domain-containing protein [bacterium]